MFQIKTDIRQFNCETLDKVEKLIRNWVIRPTDLIYAAEQKAWSPIGEHPDFEPIFASLWQEGAEGKQGYMASESAEYDLEEIVRGVDAGPLPVPEAPEGVEPPAQDGEVTTMTERTAQLLGLEDETGAEPSSPAQAGEADKPAAGPSLKVVVADETLEERPSGRHNLPEELFLTNEVEREEVNLAAEEARLDELGDYDGLPTASELDAGWDLLMDMEDLRRTGEFNREAGLPGLESKKPSEEITKVTAMECVLEEDRGHKARASAPSPPLTVEVDSSLGHEATVPADKGAARARVASVGDEASDPADTEEKANRTGMINISDLLKVREAAPAAASGDADASKEIAAVVKTARTRAPNPNQDREFVSEGYSLPIPVAIELDERDRALGLAFSAADEATKDARFPKPYPKKLNQLIHREFVLGAAARLPSRSTPPPSASAQANAARAMFHAQLSAQTPPNESAAQGPGQEARMHFILVALAVVGFLLLITLLIIYNNTL
jgi:hypothetical protein